MPYTFFVTFILLLSGCTINESTITQSEAIARVDQLIHETANTLTPKPRLELIPSSTTPGSCLDSGKPQGQVVINRKYWLRGIPKDETMSIAHQVRAYWKKQGHRIVGSGGPKNPDLSGESHPDGFILALSWTEGDNLYLAATSPCVWPDETPSSKSS
ncbi:hypothetical protein [Thermoactinospora rubra]|uniref:hypothetical protein n=1 Tax=Thermoactinospora rubra TaxID=1088767 RepID=UPI00117D20F2|nr:hypothetical protein [Thermoactinospora rubra]